MHDIDAQISRITGQDNYMETLQKITGNIMTIDADMYHATHKKVSACDFNIKVLLSRLSESNPENTNIKNIADEYITISTKLNIKDNTFVMYQRKKAKNPKPPREIIDPEHTPPKLVQSGWFKQIKHIEKEITKYVNTVFPSNSKPEDITFVVLNDTIYKNNPEVRELQTIYDIHIADEQTFTSFMQLRKCAGIVINQLLMPMYDVKGTIRKHWGKIERIFTSKAFKETGLTSPEDIIDMLNQFIIAKYRATITGNNKHYAKLFLSVVGNDNVSNMDGARFIEIMDSIDLDKLDKNENVYKFASNAKNIIHQIVNNENINAKEIIDQLNASFGVGDVDDKPNDNADDDSNVNSKGNEVHTIDGNKYDDLL